MRIWLLLLAAVLLAAPAAACLFAGGWRTLLGGAACGLWLVLAALVWAEYRQGEPPDENP